MNDIDLRFPDLVDRMRHGDERAVAELYGQVELAVLRCIRRKLNSGLRTRFDSSDFMQSAWASFFRRIEEVPCFSTEWDLIRHLQAIARNKVTDEVRRNMLCGKRDFRREAKKGVGDQRWPVVVDVADQRQSEPTAMASAREVWHDLNQQLPDLHRHVLELRCEGLTYVEIATSLDIHERSARKIMARVCDLVESQ
ncbi:MAG: RNA polymerase sigma factor [Planctomycetota bacterium]